MPALPELEGVSHRHVEVAGIRLHVAEAGAGDPVLLVHGWPQHWWCWRHVIPPLAAERRVICLDLRGFGWSDAPPGATTRPPSRPTSSAPSTRSGSSSGGPRGARLGRLGRVPRVPRASGPLQELPGAQHVPALAGAAAIARGAARAVAALVPGGARHAGLGQAPGPAHGLPQARDHHRRRAPRRLDRGRPRVVRGGAPRARACRASVRLYRTFLLRELAPYAAGTHRGRRLRVPTLLLHGTRDLAVDHRRLGDWEAWADRMSVELRDDSGHFIAEELPGVVAERALALSRGAP